MIAVQFDKVSKAYDLHAGERTILRSIRTVSGLQKKDDLFYALSDVSFTINKGDAFGIIGRNGAGKSTILKIISGITQPTSGQVTVNGLVSSLIELGAGFHPDLTGRENVYLSAAILGITKKVIDRKFKEIVDFAAARIANFKVPRYVKFVRDFPMTGSGKVRKFLLREQAIAELGLTPEFAVGGAEHEA